MSAVPMRNLDLMTPPVVKTIQQRSLLVGLVFGVIAAVGRMASARRSSSAPICMAFMAWLGVTLGSMAILMLRHLTKGAWGMVIRRILGAAMRCVPLMAVLFVPLLFGIRRLYIWARPLDAIADKHLREHLQEITKTYLSVNGFIIRAVIYFAIWNLLSFFLTKWSAEQDHPPMRDNSARFKALSGPGLILYGFTITFAVIDWVMSIDPKLDFHHLWSVVPDRTGAVGAVFRDRGGANSVPLQADVGIAETGTGARSRKIHADLHHGVGLLRVFAVAHHLGGQLARRNYLVHAAAEWRLGICWIVPGPVPLRRAVRVIDFASVQARYHASGLAGGWMLLMRYVDLFWIIEPNFSVTFNLTWLDIVVPIAIGGLWLAYFFRNLGSMPLVPAYDVYAVEVLEPEHEHHA